MATQTILEAPVIEDEQSLERLVRLLDSENSGKQVVGWT